jgi:hypothetical protein
VHVYTDRNLPLRVARNQRYAGEGESVFGLTKNAAITIKWLARRQQLFFCPISAGLPSVPDGFWCAEAKARKERVRGVGGLPSPVSVNGIGIFGAS